MLNSTGLDQDVEAASAKCVFGKEQNNGSSASVIHLESESTSTNKNFSKSLQRDKPSKIAVEVDVEVFIGLVEKGIDCWVKAGECLESLVKERGVKVFSEIQKQCSWMTQSLLWNFYKIGTGEIYPWSLILPSNAAVSRRLAALPYGIQKKICDEGLDVCVDGSRTFRRTASSLTLRECRIALTSSGIRPMCEQASLLQKETKREVTTKKELAKINNIELPQRCGVFCVRLNLSTGQIVWERFSGTSPFNATPVTLKPNKGKLEAYVALYRPKPFQM